jgi:hypothetical protein
MPSPDFIKRPDDLVTTDRATAEGFLNQALEKGKRARPFVVEAAKFRQALAAGRNIKDLLELQEFQDHLLSAAGFSDKSLNHIEGDDLKNSMKAVFDEILGRNPDGWRDEILYRYLLTKGDSLGGAMRNLAGSIAQAMFSKEIESALRIVTSDIHVERSQDGEKIQRITWLTRRLLFDKRSALVGKGVDVILLNSSSQHSGTTLLSEKANYIACGELKGGIDPAGADEHWKTASGAFERIRKGLPR